MTDTAFEVLREMRAICMTHPEAYDEGDFYEFYKEFINETSRRRNDTGGENGNSN